MANNAYKVLGQSALAATTDTNVYTVPASTETIISTVVIANRGSTAATFRVAIRPAGATIANQHYIAFDVPIAGNDSTTLTLGLTMEATDVLTARASTADISVNVFGTELS
jgi:glucose-6-phosphate dehydrogenase assembly protein OpcA